MHRSVLLAKLIGPPFLAIGLGLLLNQNTYWGMIDEVIRHPSPIPQCAAFFVMPVPTGDVMNIVMVAS
jgi:hypothetical protein